MADAPGTLTFKSTFGVAATLDRLAELATSKGLKIFARIDFARDAHGAGLELRPEQLLIFGSPKAGTPLMQASPTVGLDLPLKALAYEDDAGTTWIVINDPAHVLDRHSVPRELQFNIQGAAALVRAAAGNPPIEPGKIP